jgi:hypothetical protein
MMAMIKKSRAIFALTTVLVIIFLVQPITQLSTVEGNPIPTSPIMVIALPEPYEKGRIYQETTLHVAVIILQSSESPKITDISYSLDGNTKMPLNLSFQTAFGKTGYNATGTMGNLTNGYHSLTAYALDTQRKVMSTSTTFLVNTSFSYPKFLLSPMNASYSKNEVPLTYTTARAIRPVVYYRLDDYSNYIGGIVLTYNITLSGLSEGQHKVTIKAENVFGNYSENTVYFEVNTVKPEQPLVLGTQTIALGIAVAVIVVVAVAVIMLYKKKNRVSDGIG